MLSVRSRCRVIIYHGRNVAAWSIDDLEWSAILTAAQTTHNEIAHGKTQSATARDKTLSSGRFGRRRRVTLWRNDFRYHIFTAHARWCHSRLVGRRRCSRLSGRRWSEPLPMRIRRRVFTASWNTRRKAWINVWCFSNCIIIASFDSLHKKTREDMLIKNFDTRCSSSLLTVSEPRRRTPQTLSLFAYRKVLDPEGRRLQTFSQKSASVSGYDCTKWGLVGRIIFDKFRVSFWAMRACLTSAAAVKQRQGASYD